MDQQRIEEIKKRCEADGMFEGISRKDTCDLLAEVELVRADMKKFNEEWNDARRETNAFIRRLIAKYDYDQDDDINLCEWCKVDSAVCEQCQRLTERDEDEIMFRLEYFENAENGGET